MKKKSTQVKRQKDVQWSSLNSNTFYYNTFVYSQTCVQGVAGLDIWIAQSVLQSNLLDWIVNCD
jgi:hypothetical protein